MPNTTVDVWLPMIHRLQHQVVRDLAWCCFSAPLLRQLPDTDAAILPFADDQLWPWLIALDQQPEPLISHIANVKSTRLGIYYETLWRFYFSQRSEWELLHHNLQVVHDRVTLGAFDFLCRRGNEYWHIETAVKFYLCDADNSADAGNWGQWIGPASDDRLATKLARLREHQLPLHQTPAGACSLQGLYPEAREWKMGLCLQGYLFSPPGVHYSPAYADDNHGKGHWWRHRDFSQYLHDHPDVSWLILERQRWLSPAQSHNSDNVLRGAKLGGKLATNEMSGPLLLAASEKSDVNENRWREDWRGFVVPDQWPLG